MAKFYIATSLSRANHHNFVRDLLVQRGHELTYDWSVHGSVKSTTVEKLNQVAHKELEGVLSADFVLILLPGGHGTHFELGAALATGKNVILHSQEEYFFEPCEKTCAFYHHNDISRIVCSFNDLELHLDAIELHPRVTA